MSKRSPPRGDYDVGYGKPPKRTQFPKGVSGNPRGRPKDSRNFTTLINQVFGRKILVQQDGRSRSITIAEAVLTKIMTKALSGDAAAQRLSIHLLQQAPSDVSDALPALLDSDSDRALLRSVFDEFETAARERPTQGGDDDAF